MGPPQQHKHALQSSSITLPFMHVTCMRSSLPFSSCLASVGCLFDALAGSCRSITAVASGVPPAPTSNATPPAEPAVRASLGPQLQARGAALERPPPVCTVHVPPQAAPVPAPPEGAVPAPVGTIVVVPIAVMPGLVGTNASAP